MFRKSLIGRRYIMEEEERKTPEREAPAYNEMLREVQSMILLTNYRQIWMIHSFIKSLLRPGS